MPQFERRLYDPSDDAQAFDGGEDELGDEGSRLPLLIIIALVVLLSFGGVVWLAYTQGVERGREDAPRIMAEQQNQKIALGEQKNPYSNLKIYQPPSNDADTNADNAPQPPTEVKPKTPAVQAGAKPIAVAQTPTAVTTPKPAVAKPPAQKTQIASAAQTTPPATVVPRQIGPLASASPDPTPQTAQTSIRPPVAKVNNIQAAPNNAADVTPTAVPAGTPTTQGGQGGYVLQIGSFTSEAEANTSWQSYKQAHASVASYGPDIRSADLGSKGTWYRLRVGPFATLPEANAACAKLKAQGAHCFPAKQ